VCVKVDKKEKSDDGSGDVRYVPTKYKIKKLNKNKK
jgi:hypothetical protein